jgi:hypothetical protein
MGAVVEASINRCEAMRAETGIKHQIIAVAIFTMSDRSMGSLGHVLPGGPAAGIQSACGSNTPLARSGVASGERCASSKPRHRHHFESHEGCSVGS